MDEVTNVTYSMLIGAVPRIIGKIVSIKPSLGALDCCLL
jgi:hypothetical protein